MQLKCNINQTNYIIISNKAIHVNYVCSRLPPGTHNMQLYFSGNNNTLMVC